MYSYLRSPSEEQKRLVSVRFPLLKAWNGVLGHIEQKSRVSDLHVNFARELQAAQMSFFSKEKTCER